MKRIACTPSTPRAPAVHPVTPWLHHVVSVACIATWSLIAVAASGCASIVNETTQPIRVETKTAEGRQVAGVECRLTNDHGTVTLRSGETTMVRRSSRDADINCKQPDGERASGRAISRANAGLAGNVILGGGIGMIVDHHRGTAYTYPSWVQLVFGKTLVFDRSSEREGFPLTGVETGSSR